MDLTYKNADGFKKSFEIWFEGNPGLTTEKKLEVFNDYKERFANGLIEMTDPSKKKRLELKAAEEYIDNEISKLER